MPGRLVVACPLDQILKSSVANTGVEDIFYFVLFLFVDDNRGRGRLNLARQRIRGHRFQERDVKYRMDLHRVRKP